MIPFQFSLYTEYRTEISILNCSYLNLISIECLFISKFSNYIVAASKNVRKSEKLLFFKCSESRGRAIKYRPEINIFKHLDKKTSIPIVYCNHLCVRQLHFPIIIAFEWKKNMKVFTVHAQSYRRRILFQLEFGQKCLALNCSAPRLHAVNFISMPCITHTCGNIWEKSLMLCVEF